MNLAYAAVVLGSAWLLTDRQTLRLRHGILPGGLLGLALLVKMQAVFLPPLLVVWMLAFWGRQAILPVLAMAGVATAVFFAGWPWLWADPVHRFFEYFAQTTDRAVLYCYYFGHRYADRSVPWHYPFVMFLITTPVPFLLLGLWGVFLRRRSKRRADAHRRQFRLSRRENALLAGGVLIPLLVFSLTNAPVYDGERLFLVIWPLFSVWVGIATRQAFDKLRSHWNSTAAAGLLTLGFCLPLFSLIADAPCWLSSYSLLCGKLRGAAQLGMEVNYWGDALTPRFLRSVSDQLPGGARVGIAPVLHPIYVDGLKKHSWLRHRPDLTLQAFNDQDSDPPEYVLHVLRRADPWVILETPRSQRTVLGTVRRESTDLAHCLKFDWGAVPRESVSPDSVSRDNTSQPEP
jgi:4-amino-4-deoxy-L-arabinose transferase-like glycosyltransferase